VQQSWQHVPRYNSKQPVIQLVIYPQHDTWTWWVTILADIHLIDIVMLCYLVHPHGWSYTLWQTSFSCFYASAAHNRRKMHYVFWSSVCPSVVRLLMPISCDTISLYLVEGFQWNLSGNMFWLPAMATHHLSGHRWKGFQGQRSEVKGTVRPNALMQRKHTFRQCGMEAHLFRYHNILPQTCCHTTAQNWVFSVKHIKLSFTCKCRPTLKLIQHRVGSPCSSLIDCMAYYCLLLVLWPMN